MYITGVPPLIYAHRGIWKNSGDQNKPRSFVQARKLGFGIEVDFRTYGEMLLISHDPILSNWRGLTQVYKVPVRLLRFFSFSKTSVTLRWH
jgi:glycerophosphoryl diester phosphodiesterase